MEYSNDHEKYTKSRFLKKKIGGKVGALTISFLSLYGCKSLPYGIIEGAKDTRETIHYIEKETDGDSLSILAIGSYPFHFLKRFGEKIPQDIYDTKEAVHSIINSAINTFSKHNLEGTLDFDPQLLNQFQKYEKVQKAASEKFSE